VYNKNNLANFMNPDYYKRQDKLIDLDVTKFLIILVTVFVTVIIPAQLITYFQKNPNELDNIIANITHKPSSTNQNTNSGRVAGISTSASASSEEASVLGIFGDINLYDQSTQYLMLGGFFISISLLTIGYLLATEKKPKKKHYYATRRFEY
jgi:hypothetical protein